MAKLKPLVLASTSKYRARLLARLGLPFTQEAPGVDEAPFKRGKALDVAKALAVAKADAIARRRPEAIVIGSDQVCALGDLILDKPGTEANACDQLARMAGKTHELVTAVAIAHDGKTGLLVNVTKMTMRALSAAEIRAYVRKDDPLDCAGSYKIECLGIALMDRIESEDFTAIEGLPLLAVSKVLRELGLDPLLGDAQP